LIVQRDQSSNDKDAKVAEMKAKQARIPQVQKQLQPLRKANSEKEKRSQAAKDELGAATAKESQFAARLKKWQAAAINTTLIQARAELADLVLLKDEDPSVASKIAAQQKKCADLAVQYQAAKK
jgi:predicted secreted hydrolase